HLLQRLAREIAAVQQRQRQVFGQPRIGGNRGHNFRGRIVNELFQRRAGGKSCGHRLPRWAAVSRAPRTGRTRGKLLAAWGWAACISRLNAWRTNAEPCSTPPARATGTVPP